MSAPSTSPPRISPTDPPVKLLDLSERDFYNLADIDVRGRGDAHITAMLRDPIVLERFYQTLLRMKKTVEGTIAAKTAETRGLRLELAHSGTLNGKIIPDPVREALKIHAEFLKWKAGSLRFKTAVEERFTEVAWRRNILVQHHLRSLVVVERNMFADETVKLRAAITKHQLTLDNDDASDQDRELWLSLDQIEGDSDAAWAETALG